jgi:pilus assembly protein CpaD
MTMIHRLALLAAAGLSLALGGCMGTQNAGTADRGLESVNQPVVERADYALDLQTAGRSLASGERDRLQGWFDAMRLGYGDRVSIADPNGGSRAVRAEVGGVVAGYGLLLGDDAPLSTGPVAPGAIRVVVSRMRASVPGCPDWSRPAVPYFEQRASSNYGCATNGALAAMIADPADLVRGQDGATFNDPASVMKSIDRFRRREPTGATGTVRAEGVGGR